MGAYLDTVCGNLYTRPVYLGDLEACKEQGAAAGDQAYPRTSNPYPEGIAERQWWDAGWCESLDELCGEK